MSVSTWVDFNGMIPLQGEAQRVGSGAENLARGKVHTVVHLEMESTCHGTYKKKTMIPPFLSLLGLKV